MTETMTNADNFWLHMDHPTNLMVITGIMEFNERLDYDDVCETLENRLCAFDRFRQRVVMPISGYGIASWELDPFFDIRSHFLQVSLPGAGDKPALQRMVSDLMSMPLDRTKPLWTCHLIENYKTGCALFFRLHHCIADGMALVHVILSTTDKQPGIPLYADKRNKKKHTSTSSMPGGQLLTNMSGVIDKTRKIGKKLVAETSKVLSKPSYLKKLIKKTADLSVDTAKVLSRLTTMPFDPKTCLKGPLGIRKRVAWSNHISLEKVKTISKVFDATINDILIAAVTGALRRYLVMRGDRVKEIELRAAIPVNIRAPGTEFELGNKFSLVFLALPVFIKDAVFRLKEVKKRMDLLKQSPDAFVGFMVLSALGISSAAIAKRASSFFGNKATTVLTNVPGPLTPLYFSGRKVENFIGWVPRAGRVGMGISIFSYSGNVGIGVVTDEGLVSDPETLLEYFEAELNHLFVLVKTKKTSVTPAIYDGKYGAPEGFLKAGKKKDKPETDTETIFH